MTRWTIACNLVPLMVVAVSSSARAEAPTATTTKPVPTTAATVKPAPAPSLKAKIAAAKPVMKPATTLQSADDKMRAAQEAEEAAAFADALGSDGGYGSMGHRRAAANTSELGDLNTSGGKAKTPPVNTSVRSAATPDVCAEQLIGKPCTRDAMHKQISGTTTCAVHTIDNAPLDAASMQRKIEVAYLPGMRRCAKGKLRGSLLASKTTLSFAVNAKGIVVDITSAGADKTVADCVAQMAASWRFVPAKTAEQAAPRVEVVVETKP